VSARYVRIETCLGCAKEYEYNVADALCPECRAAEQAKEDAWTECVRCGGELEPRIYSSRSHLCTSCQNDDLLEDIRKWGNE
jgi:hypothetical protein